MMIEYVIDALKEVEDVCKIVIAGPKQDLKDFQNKVNKIINLTDHNGQYYSWNRIPVIMKIY